MAAKKKNKGNRKKVIIDRYAMIAILLFVGFIFVILAAAQTMYAEGEMWRTLGKKQLIRQSNEIVPNRGNIYAADGQLLAASLPLYGVYMDFHAPGIDSTAIVDSISALSAILAKKYPGKTQKAYEKLFRDKWNQTQKEKIQDKAAKKAGSDKRVKKTTRYVRIINRDINYLEMQELLTYPFFNKGINKSGLNLVEKTTRKNPFGELAKRTIGFIGKDLDAGGKAGIELRCNDILTGRKGFKTKQRIGGRWTDVVSMPAVDGMDVQTTLDMNVQEIAQNALKGKLEELQAESGCAVIMEVETGEIKAIVNLDRTSKGYMETKPNVFSYIVEPGSTFKTVSLMIALEDGVVTPEDEFNAYDGNYNPFPEDRNAGISDSDGWKKKLKGYQSVTKGMYTSSNVVISQMILKGYRKNQKKFVERIYELGLNKELTWDVPVSGAEGKSQIQHPSDKTKYWSNTTTLTRMSFGYGVLMPPIYMLMFYNGIANNGKMIKPFIIKSLMKDGKVEQTFEAEVVNPNLCSEKTLKQVQDILVGVVKDGTAKKIGSEYFQIAGKTGTARLVRNGRYENKHYVSFCGYFPAEKPKYTCFVGIYRSEEIASGAKAGMVFKEIAEKVYAKEMFKPAAQVVANDTTVTIERKPIIRKGLYNELQTVFNGLGMKYTPPAQSSEFVAGKVNYGEILLDNVSVKNGLVPNVKGMGAKDAIFALESVGLKVKLKGVGQVVNQSVEPETKAVLGSVVSIELN
ncbi:penicillin-binding protein [Dysgonomonas sp. 520]|uniref:penicillin-binding protein n=1 Tax=Dysgonomonas sp. 520 TaxID=2302931 RepID=UPI0013D66F1D|nr:penicillin-binding protein [Dysgonomonas sp. 520]NDW10874.1 PASTA domain-containing protein [Dysgonomonas sp. 520]